MATNKEQNKLNVPHLRFPEFHGEWEKCKLGDIATLTKGSGISKDQRSATGTPCILYGELYTTYKSEVINYVVSKTDISDKNLVRSCANDIIIPSSGETAIDISTARCVLSPDVLLGGDLNIIRLKDGDGRFFSYQLNGVRKYDIAKIAQGVSVVHLYGESIKGLTVSFPSNKEQQKISTLLSLIDERIATQSKLIEMLESLIKGIAHKVSKQGKPNTRLSECLQCASSTLQESDVAEVGLYPVYGANGIVGYLDTYNTTSEAIYIIKDGSGVGTVSYVNGKCSATGTLNILQTNDGFSLRYLYFMLKVFGFEPYKTGMAIPHIYFKDYGKAKIYCPNYELQNKCANLLYEIEQKATIEQKILNNLCSQKQYLLRQMSI